MKIPKIRYFINKVGFVDDTKFVIMQGNKIGIIREDRIKSITNPTKELNKNVVESFVDSGVWKEIVAKEAALM